MRKGFWRMMGVPLFILGLLYTTQVKADAPAIHIWYGHHQVFGRFGLPQRWVNILGNVSDPDGITSLNYSLNGRPEQPLSLGPDKRRLVSPGDFNIEIAYADLIIGQNQVVIKATNSLGNQTIETVTVECTKGNAWPLPYAINWSSVEKIQDVAQIVDGLWFLDKNGIRTHPDHVGYDRIVAIGDMRWTDYEVTVPVTIHAIDESAFDSSTSVGPGLGVLFRWQGHTNLPVVCPQPHCGWEPAGGSNWYEWKRNQRNLLHIHAGPGNPPDSPSPSTDTHQFETGHTYWFKARVETIQAGSLYSLKVWEKDVEYEPITWNLRRLTTSANLSRGSFLLIAHHVDAAFGNLTVVPLKPQTHWILVTKLISYLSHSPLFLASFAGVILSLIYKKRFPKVSQSTLIAMVMLFIVSLGGTYVNLQLPGILHGHGCSSRRILIIVAASEFIQSFIIATSWGLLLIAAFRRRREK